MKNKLLIGLALVVTVYLLMGIVFPANKSTGPKEAETSETTDFSFPAVGTMLLNIDKLAGSVTVNAGPDDKVTISVTKTARGANDAEAQSELKKMTADVKQQSQNLNFTTLVGGEGWLKSPSPFNTIDYRIIAPEGTALKIAGGSGSVTTKYVKGSMDITGTKLDLLLNDIRGNTTVRSESGNIRITNALGAILLDSKTAAIRLEKATGPTVSVTSNEAIFLKDTGADGDMKIAAGSGELRIDRSRAKNLDIKILTGETNITDTTADEMLTFQSQKGGLYMNRGNFNVLQATTATGQVTMKEVQGSINVNTTEGVVDIRQSTAKSLNIATTSGDVSFGGSIPDAGENVITTAKGVIQVFTPKESPFKLDARTDGGTVTFNIPVPLEGEEKSKTQVRGTANGGTSLLTLRSESGDIKLSSRLPW